MDNLIASPKSSSFSKKFRMSWNKSHAGNVYGGMDAQKRSFDVIAQLASLRRYARVLVRNPDEAEDLVQDALVKAYERRGTFKSGANLRGWLLSILHNTHIDALRRIRSQRRRADDVAHLSEQESAAGQEHSVRLSQVRAAFLSLPEEQRAALSLVALEDLSYQEAAQALGVPVGTLMSRVSRARAQLRALEENPAQPVQHLRLIGGKDNDSQ